MPRENQLVNWCFTLNNPEDGEMETLLLQCKKYVYQLEEGEEEKTRHFQGVIALKKKLRLAQVKELCPRAHFEHTRSWQHSTAYCTKEEGRIEGPWYYGVRKPVRDPMDQLELKEWQQGIIDQIGTEPCDRAINWLWEDVGGTGKTTFAKHLAIKHKREMLYLTGKSGDMKYAICKFLEDDQNDLKFVILDYARSQEEYISYQGIEEIKNGIFFNSKYESNMVIYDKIHVIIFANFEPDYGKLSKDRWNVVNIA